MPEPRYDNPAERLTNILTLARKTPKELNLREGWCRVLGIEDAEDRSTLLRKLGKVMALPDEVRRAVTRLESYDENLHLGQLRPIEVALSNLNLDGQKWETFSKRISDAMVMGLQAASYELSRRGAKQGIGDEQIETVRTRLQELIDEVAEIPDDELRAFLLRHLRRLRDAVEDFKIQGGEALEAAMLEVAGGIYSKPDLVSDPANTPWVKRLVVGLFLVNQLAGAANATLALPEKVTSLLEEETGVEVVGIVPDELGAGSVDQVEPAGDESSEDEDAEVEGVGDGPDPAA